MNRMRPRQLKKPSSGNPMRHKFIPEEESDRPRTRTTRGGTLVMGGPGSARRFPRGGRPVRPSTDTTIDNIDTSALDGLTAFDRYNTNSTPTKRKFRLFKEDDDMEDIWSNIGFGLLTLLLVVICGGLITIIGIAVYEGMGIWGITIPIGLPIVLYGAYWIGRRILK